MAPAPAAASSAHIPGSAVWVADGGDHGAAGTAISAARPLKAARWTAGVVTSVGPGGVLTVEVEDGRTLTVPAEACPLQNTRDDALDDLVRADFLHEPGCVRGRGRGRGARARARPPFWGRGAFQWAGPGGGC